eukprot:15483491-Alexandrium_andersonii.AAC.1
MHVGKREGHHMAWAPVLGPRVSSTRAELCALLASLQFLAPLHLAFDNKAIVTRLRRMLGHRAAMTKPWHLVRDGDLWVQVHACMQERGWGSVRIKK